MGGRFHPLQSSSKYMMRIMKKKQYAYKLIITLQVLLLTFITITIPMAIADDSGIPPLPLILKGNATINGEPAEVGIEITAKIDEQTIGMTEISTEGIYGDLHTNRLLITSEQKEYGQIIFYIDGIEAEITGSAIQNAKPGNTINLDISTNTNQQIMDNKYLLILAGGILVIGAIVAIKCKPK